MDGRRYLLWLMLLFVIMGTMSGYLGIVHGGMSSINRDVCNSSYSTIRRIVMEVDFAQLARTFNHWAQPYVDLDRSKRCSLDGTSIKGKVQNYEKSSQNFVSIVSVFTCKIRLVVRMEKLKNKSDTKIATVQN